MSSYLADLQASVIPLPVWVVFVFWLLLLGIGNALYRVARARSASQSFVVAGGEAQHRAGGVRGLVAQSLFGSVVIILASFLGEAGFAFIGGGWVVATAASIGANLRSALFLHALSEPGAASGSVTFSTPLALRDSSFQMFGVAALALSLGILLAQLALLGGALFTTATGLGYLRRSSALRP